MSLTNEFQKDVAVKLNNLFHAKILELETRSYDTYLQIEQEYMYQISVIQATRPNHNININASNISGNWLSCLSEPFTEYNLADLTNQEPDYQSNIYSPRIDIAITPTVIKNRSRKVSLGVYRLAEEVQLFSLIHNLPFIREIESNFRRISNHNMRMHNLYPPEDVEYVNRRPMHLFGIEIENQKNPKHLMGDFLNAISLSKIPIMLFPEHRIEDAMKMLLFSSAIKNIKDVPIYNLLSRVIILTINQFRSIINSFLYAENLDLIQVENYR
ncbi:hypothetical protein ACQJ0Y_10340 [Peribacillus simplex]|uniref:hypothetical protein n=1 Tax=Peribacillus simplex TaxID=1478 RepID=UPI003CF52D7A